MPFIKEKGKTLKLRQKATARLAVAAAAAAGEISLDVALAEIFNQTWSEEQRTTRNASLDAEDSLARR